jgi:hypothetical protein
MTEDEGPTILHYAQAMQMIDGAVENLPEEARRIVLGNIGIVRGLIEKWQQDASEEFALGVMFAAQYLGLAGVLEKENGPGPMAQLAEQLLYGYGTVLMKAGKDLWLEAGRDA